MGGSFLKGTVSRDETVSRWDEPMGQWFRPRQMIVHPFFCLKIARLDATLHRLEHCKNMVFRSSRFCYDSASNLLTSVGTARNGWGDHWHIEAVTAQYSMFIDLKPGHCKIRHNLPAVAKPLDISCCDSCDTPTVAPTIVQMATVSELEAES
jgi:hypothetical protein